MSVICRALAVALVCCLAACRESAGPTQVMVVIDAEPGVRERIRDLELQVKSGSGPVDGWEQRFAGSLTAGRSEIPWPLEVALVPREGRADRSYQVEVTARGESGGAIHGLSRKFRSLGTEYPSTRLDTKVRFTARSEQR